MPTVGSTSDISLSNVSSSNIKITNKTIPTANTEESHALQDGLKALYIRARSVSVTTKCAFNVGESGVTYFTIPPRNERAFNSLSFTSKTLYVQCDQSTTLEIIELY